MHSVNSFGKPRKTSLIQFSIILDKYSLIILYHYQKLTGAPYWETEKNFRKPSKKKVLIQCLYRITLSQAKQSFTSWDSCSTCQCIRISHQINIPNIWVRKFSQTSFVWEILSEVKVTLEESNNNWLKLVEKICFFCDVWIRKM